MLFLLYTHVYDFHYRNILTAGKLKRWENRLKCYHNCCLSNAWVTIILRNSVDDFLTSVNLGQKSTVVQNHPQKSHFELSKRSNFYYDASLGIFIWFFYKARKKYVRIRKVAWLNSQLFRLRRARKITLKSEPIHDTFPVL